ncbi:wax ester/triacylglycerol synthase family O-acyltransferase [Sansalvadorimonas verongulae]|uniref:wax ester/triacylglycerol synthase family O-acyltransferase n=1 Tax=Sansalvadorimonas verongulae TaxID=2172824 RepID=UPI0012BCA206|nr:wax ester/triacylglycerol synthase family O-acyltransferase [Sansalvadorimonas verongulae]MTI15035.1 wax ester/triacylglycerol synthase family O-acyltransferase [Sansalvadorimonas verongulae]
MHQVSPQNNLFLHMESGTTPMHVGLLCIYNQSTADGGQVRFKNIIKTFESRLHKVSVLRQRLVKIPLKLDYPYWIDDPDFDIEYHMRHIALPKPGDWRQLCILIARLNSRPLDMGRPLWEVTVIEGLDKIEGLPKGCFAIFGKLHRSLFDRDTGGQLIAALHDLTPEGMISLPDHPLTVDRVPNDLELLSRAVVNRAKIVGNYVNLARKYTYPAAKKLFESACKTKSCAFGHAPHTRFNSRISPHRVFAGTSFSFDDIKRIRAQFPESRFNDVLIAAVGGALHRYLTAKGELPKESMTAMFPVPGQPQTGSNKMVHQFSYIFPRLFTEIEDDKERLNTLIEHLQRCRSETAWLDWQFADDAAHLFPNTAADMFLKTAIGYQNARHSGPFFNTFISSVAGPHISLYHAGAQLHACYATDSIYNNLGLAHNAFSYNNTLNISVNCCRNMMPDPEFYIQCLNSSFKALLPEG